MIAKFNGMSVHCFVVSSSFSFVCILLLKILSVYYSMWTSYMSIVQIYNGKRLHMCSQWFQYQAVFLLPCGLGTTLVSSLDHILSTCPSPHFQGLLVSCACPAAFTGQGKTVWGLFMKHIGLLLHQWDCLASKLCCSEHLASCWKFRCYEAKIGESLTALFTFLYFRLCLVVYITGHHRQPACRFWGTKAFGTKTDNAINTYKYWSPDINPDMPRLKCHMNGLLMLGGEGG